MTDYQLIEYMFGNNFIAKKDGKVGIVDKGGNTVVEFSYTNISYLSSEGFIEAEKEDGQYDLLDTNFSVKTSGIVSEINTDKKVKGEIWKVTKNQLRDIAYSIHFLLMRKDDKLEDAKAINFQNYFGSKHIDQLNIKEHYFLIFIGGLFPNGFYMKFFTDFIIEPLKYSDYLSEFKGYTNKFN